MHKVVLGALVRENHVLLAHRSPHKQTFPGVWDLPGGVIEAGESALEALARELEEELGVQIVTTSAVHLADVVVGPADDPAHISAWLVGEWHGTPTNAAPEEHEDIGWFEVDTALTLAHEPVHAALVSALAVRGAGSASD